MTGMLNTTREHLAAARLWAANRAPYFATTLFALSPIAQPGLNTVGVDRRWRLYVDPRVDWRRELAAQVRAGIDVVAGAVDYSYRRPSRRRGSPIGRAVVLPALVQPVPAVTVIVDTSASMDEHAIGASLVEIKGILHSSGVAGQRLVVLSCDTAVRNAQRVFSAESVRPIGGGGTDLRAGIERALDLRPRPDVIVVLTDGFTPWPDHRPVATVIVALLGAGPDPPAWARVVRIPFDDGTASD